MLGKSQNLYFRKIPGNFHGNLEKTKFLRMGIPDGPAYSTPRRSYQILAGPTYKGRKGKERKE